MTMKIFLSIAAVLAWVFGLALILTPDKFYSPTGIIMTPLLATIAQAHGATLFGLGVVNWLAKKADRKGLIAVLTGNLFVQTLSLGVVIRTIMLVGMAVFPGAIIHITLGSLFAYFLYKAYRIPNAA